MELELITWNINWSHRTVDEFKEFDWSERKDDIFNFLKRYRYAVLCLQEVHADYIVELKEQMIKTHDLLFHLSNPGRKCYVCTCVPKGIKHELVDIPQCEGENMRHPFLGVRLIDSKVDIVNCHLPMEAKYRMELSNHIAKWTTLPWVSENVILCGDFNTFPDAGGVKQVMDIQRISGCYEVTSVMIAAEEYMERVLKTFEPYPYDSVPEGVMDYHLDHIFCRGKGLIPTTALCHVEQRTIFGGIDYCGTSDHDYFGTSDHFPVHVRFEK